MRESMTDKKWLIQQAQAGILAYAETLASNFPTAYITKDGFAHDHGNIMVVISRMHKALALLEEAGVLKRKVPREDSVSQLRDLHKAALAWGIKMEDEMFAAQARADAAEAKVKELETKLAGICFSQVGPCGKCDYCKTLEGTSEKKSSAKTKDLEAVKAPVPTTQWDNMIPIKGNTYPVRKKLKELGGVWNFGARRWYLPKNSAEEAQNLVNDVFESYAVHGSPYDYDYNDYYNDADYYDDPAGDHDS